MYCQTLLTHFCSLLVCLSTFTNAKPVFLKSVIPTINARDLIGLLVGGNPLPDSGATPPSSLDPLHTPTTSPIEPSRFRTSSFESSMVTAVLHVSTPTVTLPTKSNVDTAFVVQTSSPSFLPEDPTNISSPPSSPTTTGWVGDASATPPAELTEWKVIGIGVITVTLIAILILSISFFDSWWGFLRAVTCRKKTGEGEGKETMVPDGESLRKSWEFKLSNEDGHRYPTLPSMESIQKRDGFL